jgi:outer membrane lipoprotein carrier protein
MKGTRSIPIIIVLLSFFICPVKTQEDGFSVLNNPEEVIRDFQAKQKTIKTFSCAFNQTKYISYLSSYIKSSGKFYFKKEHNIRWEYTEPYQYAIIINEGKLKIESNNNDLIYKLKNNDYFERISNIVMDSFYGNVFENAGYNSILEENADQYRLTLTPKGTDLKSMISTMQLYFHKQTLIISSIVFNEPSKDYTSISFSGYVFNAPIDPQLFKSDR